MNPPKSFTGAMNNPWPPDVVSETVNPSAVFWAFKKVVIPDASVCCTRDCPGFKLELTETKTPAGTIVPQVSEPPIFVFIKITFPGFVGDIPQVDVGSVMSPLQFTKLVPSEFTTTVK